MKPHTAKNGVTYDLVGPDDPTGGFMPGGKNLKPFLALKSRQQKVSRIDQWVEFKEAEAKKKTDKAKRAAKARERRARERKEREEASASSSTAAALAEEEEEEEEVSLAEKVDKAKLEMYQSQAKLSQSQAQFTSYVHANFKKQGEDIEDLQEGQAKNESEISALKKGHAKNKSKIVKLQNDQAALKEGHDELASDIEEGRKAAAESARKVSSLEADIKRLELLATPQRNPQRKLAYAAHQAAAQPKDYVSPVVNDKKQKQPLRLNRSGRIARLNKDAFTAMNLSRSGSLDVPEDPLKSFASESVEYQMNACLARAVEDGAAVGNPKNFTFIAKGYNLSSDEVVEIIDALHQEFSRAPAPAPAHVPVTPSSGWGQGIKQWFSGA